MESLNVLIGELQFQTLKKLYVFVLNSTSGWRIFAVVDLLLFIVTGQTSCWRKRKRYVFFFIYLPLTIYQKEEHCLKKKEENSGVIEQISFLLPQRIIIHQTGRWLSRGSWHVWSWNTGLIQHRKHQHVRIFIYLSIEFAIETLHSSLNLSSGSFQPVTSSGTPRTLSWRAWTTSTRLGWLCSRLATTLSTPEWPSPRQPSGAPWPVRSSCGGTRRTRKPRLWCRPSATSAATARPCARPHRGKRWHWSEGTSSASGWKTFHWSTTTKRPRPLGYTNCWRAALKHEDPKKKTGLERCEEAAGENCKIVHRLFYFLRRFWGPYFQTIIY